MVSWIYDPNQFEEQDFAPIPEGDHRVRISDVAAKTFSSGNEGYEITLDVSGYNSRLWYYLVINPSDPKKTNQRIGSFFSSFGIVDHDLNHFHGWKGKVGGVRVVHEEYKGQIQAKAAFVITGKKLDNLPPWKEKESVTVPTIQPVEIDDDDLPFM